MKNNPDNVTVRTTLLPGDLGTVAMLHGKLYAAEYAYGIEFEAYVAAGLHEFFVNYDPAVDRVWICEDPGKIIGSLFLMHRGRSTAQLRYFLLLPEYRGIGLGRKLMDLFMECLREKGYSSVYLWTEKDLTAAAALYRKYGFTLTEEKPSEAFGRPVVEQRYDLILSP